MFFMNLFRKSIATIALTAMVVATATPSVGAYTNASKEAADALAAKGVINSQANPADYNLDQNILRQEVAKVAANISNTTPVTTCEGKFADVSATTPNTWACSYVEALLAKGLVSANVNFNPEANITKSETVKIMLEAAGYTDIYTDVNNWQAEVVATAVAEGVLSTSFTDYNTPATRGFVFEMGANAIDAIAMGEDDDILGLLQDLVDGDIDMGGDTTDTTDTTTTVSSDASLMVELSPETPASATVPQGISGLPVASFDFTAGSEDVTINSLVLKRRGLSDSNTLSGLAAFTSEGRASKAKDDSQNNNTEATLTLDNGGLVVMAGETVTITIVADVNTSTTSDEFAIELLEVNASTDVEGVSNLVGNTMRIGWVVAATLTIKTDGTFSNPKIGEESADIFKFKVEGSNDKDLVLKEITFKGEGSIDEEDELMNYKLLHGSTVVAETTMANGKYVTFNLGEGVTIPEDQTERFSVQADILGGAGKTIAFKVDKTLDVRAIDTQYGFGANINIDAVDAADGVTLNTTANELGIQTVQAGELTLVDIDAPTDKIRSNKTNVELGSINVTNVSWNNLELQKFGVDVAVSTGTLTGTFENFEAVVNGTSYELTEVTGGYSDTDLSISLPQGTTKIVLRADTKENLIAGMKVDISLTNPATQFYVVELGDDKQVTDLTPSSLSFKQLEVLAAGATASVTPTADLKVVRGAKSIVSEVFTVKASEASALTMDEVKATFTMSGGVATNQEVAKVSLYKDTVSDANLLDQVSGSQLASGVATFNGFTVDIAANETRTFVVTMTFVDGNGVSTKSDYNTTITSLSLYDDETDDVYANGSTSSTVSLVSSTSITVTEAGALSVAYDSNNTDNEDPKTLLAGESAVVYSADVQATNEEVDVEKVVFTLSATGSAVKAAIVNANLYLDGQLIATNTNADIDETDGTITFDNLTGLIIPEENSELALGLNTATIGYQKVGATVTGLYVSDVLLTTITGVDSGKTVTQQSDATDGNTFSVVPAIVTPSVIATLSGGQAKVKFTVNTGDNTQTSSNTAPSVTLTDLVFSELGNNTDGYDIYKDGDSGVKGTISSTWAFTDNGIDLTFSDTKTYVIVPKGDVDSTYTLNLTKQGVFYTVNGITWATGITSNLTNEVELGSKTY